MACEMEGKVEQTKIKKFTTFLIILLLLLTFTNVPIALISLVKTACAADIATYSDSNSQIRITIPGEEPPPPPPPGLDTTPRILWYDLQSKAGFSKLNSQIDVNQEYKFCISISSDQGWDDIDYIDISAWYDNGSESTTYNNSGNLGGNLNMLLQYENTTGVANYTMLWPDDEVTVGSFTESAETDPNGSAGFTECRNLTFFFTPGYQFRYAPGDGGWNNTTNAYNDIWSWNFKISVKDGGENASGPSTVSVIDEFGVYSYTEIVSEGLPSIQGIPGNVSEASNVNITTRSNVYYSLSVDVDTFLHKTHSTANMSNQTIWVRGGNLITFTNFTGNEPIYLYGSSTTFVDAEDNNTSKTINNVGYKCNIPFGQLPGDYYATTYYMFRTPIT